VTLAASWLAAAHAALDASGAAIRPYFRSGLGAELKGDASPVTVADRLAEEILRDTLARHFPDYGLLGEEFPATQENARFVWVICTLLALLEDGVPVLGLIDQPVTGERWIGGRDVAPRFIGKFGGKIGPRSLTELNEAELSSTAPEAFDAESAARFARLQTQCRRIYWGGDAYAYGLLALGQIDVVAESGLKPWDWAALAPVVEAAGGVITDWSGRKLQLGCDGTVLAAANAELHAAALSALK
jgi:histidinol phosphatase-like enzyme (inositol monophosphatase family)